MNGTGTEAGARPDGPGGGPEELVESLADGPADPGPARIYKRPESVLVVIVTRGGEFLLLRRTRPSGFWQSITGSLRRGESARATAVREVWEETGLRVSPARLLDLRHSERFPILPAWRDSYAPGVHYNREHWFALQLAGRRLIRLNPEEHIEHRWEKAPRAAAMATSWTNRNAVLWIAHYGARVAWEHVRSVCGADTVG